jgi:hypothetical protein
MLAPIALIHGTRLCKDLSESARPHARVRRVPRVIAG